MDCGLFLKEKDDFFGRMFGLRLEKPRRLKAAMEKSIEMGKPLKKDELKPFLVVPVGLTHAGLQKAFRKKLGVQYSFPRELDDLEKTRHERWPKNSYFIRHGGHQKATAGDKELKLLSPKKIWERGIKTMTSLEISEFFFEFMFADGVPIDAKSISFASGSCLVEGDVSIVYWYRGGWIQLGWSDKTDTHNNLRSRAVAD
jgi:hypothetical protein